jgi:hypothetical protein
LQGTGQLGKAEDRRSTAGTQLPEIDRTSPYSLRFVLACLLLGSAVPVNGQERAVADFLGTWGYRRKAMLGKNK